MMVLLVTTAKEDGKVNGLAPVAVTTMAVTVPFMVFSCIFFHSFVFFFRFFFVLLRIVSFLRFLCASIFWLLLSKPCGFCTWLHVTCFFGNQRINEGAGRAVWFLVLFCLDVGLVCCVCVCLFCLFLAVQLFSLFFVVSFVYFFRDRIRN